MKTNDIVIHDSFGIGIVTKIENSGADIEICHVKMLDQSTKKIISSFLRPLSDTFVKFTVSGGYRSMFSTRSYQRGVDYQKKGAVSQINFSAAPSLISAVVSGTQKYTTQIFVNGNRVRTECSCPVGDHCKHAASLFCELQNEIKSLRSEYSMTMLRDDFDQLSENEKLDLLASEAAFGKKIDSALNFVNGLSEDFSFGIAKVLDAYVSSGNTKNSRYGIIMAAQRLPDSTCFVSYLDNVLDGWDGGYYYPKNGELSASEVKSLERYFNFDYDVYKGICGIESSYSLISPAGKTAYKIVKSNDDFYVVVDKIALRHAGLFDYVYERVSGKYQDEIDKRMEQISEELKIEEKERKVLELKNSLDELCASLLSKNVALNDNTKADIEFCFENLDYQLRQTNVDKGLLYLELKIGIGRKYVIKDLLAFAQRFEKNESFRYGKELELTHRSDNIEASKQSALNTLLIMLSGMDKINFERGKRYLPLDGPGFYSIIRHLDGQKVVFNDTGFYVCSEDGGLNVSIDRDYIISLSGLENDDILIDGGERLVVISFSLKKIRIINVSIDEKKLLLFAKQQSGQSLEPVLDTFRDEVFSRLHDRIETDDSLKDQFKISNLIINGYFDYEKDKITVLSSFEKDGVEVPQDSLSLSVDKAALDNYLAYLAMLGFKDNVMSDSGNILSFLSMDLSELKKYCSVYLSESIQNKTVQVFHPAAVRISYENNMMNAFLEESEFSDDELSEILKALKRKKKYVLLSGDRIINLSEEDALDFEEIVSDLGLNRDNLSQSVQIPVSKALRAFAHEKGCRVDDYLSEMISQIKNFKSSDLQVPKVDADLRPYQIEGYKWLRILSNYHVGGILADDMGLGKTLEVITLMKADTSERPSLVVCPKSLVFNWINEFSRFDPSAEVVEIYGPAPERQSIIENIDENKKICYVTSYDSLRNDIEFYKAPLNYLILDEAQYIKNVNAQKSKSVKVLNADHKFALTGTPVENNVIDLWSIFDFIMPGYLDDLSDFKSEYTKDEDYTDKIAKAVAPFILRRTKADVLKDLPEKFEHIYSAEMTSDQRKVYDAYRLDAKRALEEGSGAFEILPYLMRLRQLCDDPSIILEDYEGGSGKLDALSDILEEYLAAGHRILLFSQFVKAIEQIEKLLRKKAIAYYKITGDTDSKERIRLMNDFNEKTDADVFLISLKAGGTGLNLIGADTVIHFDPWWNVAAENQASDRAHRIGQQRTVEVIKLICDNSVEQNVIELQNMKKDLIDKLISDNDSSVTGINLEDIKYILKK